MLMIVMLVYLFKQYRLGRNYQCKSGHLMKFLKNFEKPNNTVQLHVCIIYFF